jgi:2,4-dienoyl-CoA reductase-like NADH-dependent reductase (Old Yellow Enzyme family)
MISPFALKGRPLSVSLTTPLTLPCGAVLANRMAKAAITEGLADPRGWPTEELERLYRRWSQGGFGLMITGNVIVDGAHLERPGNVILADEVTPEQMAKLRSWAKIGTQDGAHLWAQLSHSGRQTQKAINPRPLSPSAIAVGLPGRLFGAPQEMTEDDIVETIGRFASAARICKDAGFTGVQIHAAHGYLISCFLNPKANQRSDAWGGSLANRACFLLSIVSAVREAVGPEFPISVKLNSADFQKGGLSFEESQKVALMLEQVGVDLLEISGGSYESPAMVGEKGGGADVERPAKASTLAREAYFFEFARSLRQRLKIPIMLTGGLRSRKGMYAALEEGVDVLGIARPVSVEPEAMRRFMIGAIDVLTSWEARIRRERGIWSSNSPFSLIRTLNSFAGIYWFYAQIYRLGRGDAVDTDLWPVKAMIEVMSTERRIQSARVKFLSSKDANRRSKSDREPAFWRTAAE